jgi:hypothetical protein
MDALDDDQNLFKTMLEAGRDNVDLLEGLSRPDNRYLAYRHTFGENAIIAGGVEHFAHLHLLLVLYVIDLALALSQTLDCALNAILIGDHTSRKGAICDQQNLRSRGV